MSNNFNEHQSLDDILSSLTLSSITSTSNENFTTLPAGYYKCEVVDAFLRKSKSDSSTSQAVFKLQVIGNGITIDDDDNIVSVPGVNSLVIGKYSTLRDIRATKNFISDMLKFINSDGSSMFQPIEFSTHEKIEQALTKCIGKFIVINSTISSSGSTWYSFVDWSTAIDLGIEY